MISKNIMPHQNTIIIRITSNRDFITMTNRKYFQGVLELRFDDISDTHPTDDVMLYGQMTKVHYLKIIDFYEKYKKTAKRIIVHCDAGQSRSPAVALAILDYLIGDHEQAIRLIELNKHWKPNIHVLSFFKTAYWLGDNQVNEK
jgi:predicted protein tyrosine phosphatase